MISCMLIAQLRALPVVRGEDPLTYDDYCQTAPRATCVYTCPVVRGFRSLVLQCVCGVYAGDYAHILAISGSSHTRLGSERACVFSGVRMFGCSVWYVLTCLYRSLRVHKFN